MTTELNESQVNEHAIAELVRAHAARTDEPLVLAVRYEPAGTTRDIGLLEVLRNFPGADDDDLLVTEFEPSTHLRTIGNLHLVLGSPAQLRSAIERDQSAVRDFRHATVVFDDGSQEANCLKELVKS